MKNQIFVVEDDADLRFTFRVILESGGYTVGLFENGDSMLSQAVPDVYLLDNQLPGGQSGVSICRALRADPARKNIPILIISGNKQIEEEAINAGADAFISKPVEYDELLGIIKQELAKRN